VISQATIAVASAKSSGNDSLIASPTGKKQVFARPARAGLVNFGVD
jgi:hypothetical protein